VHTEGTILDALHRLMNGRTTLMIAHRPSTLRACNMILILEPGGESRMTDQVEAHLQGLSAVGRGDWKSPLVEGGAERDRTARGPVSLGRRDSRPGSRRSFEPIVPRTGASPSSAVNGTRTRAPSPR